MGKITTLLLVMSGIDLLFYFTGLISCDITINNNCNTLLTQLVNPSVILSASIITGGATTLGIILFNLFKSGIGSVNIGNLFSNLRYAIVIPFVAYIAKLIGDGIVIFDKIASINSVIAILFLSPIFIVVILSIYALLDSGITV